MSSAPPSESPAAPARKPAGITSTMLKPVFIPASIAIFALLGATVIFSRVAGDALDGATSTLNRYVTDGVGWWYVIVVNIFLVFSLYCAFSRVGKIKLGRDDEKPEFGVITWLVMLFAAGMGIGLVFFGVAEPLWHFVAPPEAFGNEPQSLQAAQDSVGLMMLQWGVHPWSIYAVVGLGLAYMTFRRGRPLAIRWLLEPLLGRKRVEGPIGHAIDAVAIVGTLFGVATSFGFGVSQIIGGLTFLGWAEESPMLIVGLIIGITLLATWSVVSGVHRGLKWLSNINMAIAAGLALVVFLLGPTLFLLKAFPENLGRYLFLLPETMLHTGSFASDGWEAAWTIAYWGWWTSWAPFVGMFIARISRGRTIRQFVIGVLTAPTLASLFWFTIFGNTAIFMQSRDGNLAVQDPVTGEFAINSNTALFQVLESFPSALAVILSVVTIVVIILFFVTSSDSGSMVIDMLASGGATETPVQTRIYWSFLEGTAAAVLLVFGGNLALTALQTLSISTAAPFSIILALGCISLLKAFKPDVESTLSYMEVVPVPRKEPAQAGDESWARRELRGLRQVSATYAGLPSPGEGSDQDGDRHIISFRHLHPAKMDFDPQTGDARHAVEVEDPLAGEVFDTPEFESSHEYAKRGAHTGEDTER